MGKFSENKIDWAPFTLLPEGKKALYPRSLQTPAGLGDRLCFVAFAEKQAQNAFLLASEIFSLASPGVRAIWKLLSEEEGKHLQWLLWRIEELGVTLADRPQSLALWKSFDRCNDLESFAQFMANAEERGRTAGEQFCQTLATIDPTTARLFGQIAKEEREHIRLAQLIIDLNFQIPENFEPKLEGLPLEQYGEWQSAESGAGQSDPLFGS